MSSPVNSNHGSSLKDIYLEAGQIVGKLLRDMTTCWIQFLNLKKLFNLRLCVYNNCFLKNTECATGLGPVSVLETILLNQNVDIFVKG